MVLAVGTLPYWPGVAGVLWVLGSSLHLLLTLYIMGVWIHHEHFEIHHINPAWFIPMVGNVLVPIAGVPLGFVEISWFLFSIGILFWLILFAITVHIAGVLLERHYKRASLAGEETPRQHLRIRKQFY